MCRSSSGYFSVLVSQGSCWMQTFYRCHGKVGYIFQGRFKAIAVDSDSYLLALCRYVELNPVRAAWLPSRRTGGHAQRAGQRHPKTPAFEYSPVGVSGAPTDCAARTRPRIFQQSVHFLERMKTLNK